MFSCTKRLVNAIERLLYDRKLLRLQRTVEDITDLFRILPELRVTCPSGIGQKYLPCATVGRVRLTLDQTIAFEQLDHRPDCPRVRAKFQGFHGSELHHYFNQFLFYYHLREAFWHVIAALAGVWKGPSGFARRTDTGAADVDIPGGVHPGLRADDVVIRIGDSFFGIHDLTG